MHSLDDLDDADDFLQMVLTGLVVRVEHYNDPVNCLVLVFLNGRRVTISAVDDNFVIGEENLPTC